MRKQFVGAKVVFNSTFGEKNDLVREMIGVERVLVSL